MEDFGDKSDFVTLRLGTEDTFGQFMRKKLMAIRVINKLDFLIGELISRERESGKEIEEDELGRKER